MKIIRAIDKKTGEFVGKQRAPEKSEAERHSHDYSCLNPACSCSYHFRRAVRVKENTEYRPATFVKNRNSKHVIGCSYDYSAFAETHRDIVFYDEGSLHFRIQFPLGAHRSDQRPWEKGVLSENQIRAAHNNIDKRGFASLRAFVDFIEKKFEGGLNDPAMEDIYLYYQGQSYDWNDLWIPSNNYSAFLDKARQVDEEFRSVPVFSVVKPDHLGKPTEKGRPKIICRPQYAKDGFKNLSIKPVIVCGDETMARHFQTIAEKEGTVMIASRPFLPEKQHGSDTLLYLKTPQISQLAQVNPDEYWHRIPGPRHQGVFKF